MKESDRTSFFALSLGCSLSLASVVAAQGDTVSPSPVTNLTVVSNGPSSVTITWTAPGDDGTAGTAKSYDVRYANTPISDNVEFAAAVQATGEPTPRIAGTTETFAIPELSRARIYYFSVRAVDEAGNTGQPSNEASGNTQFEGYGYVTTGGSGDDVYHVTSLADSGPGTLRAGILNNRSGARTIVFDVGGTITLLSDISIRFDTGTDHITIDGSTAPSPGITVRKQPCPVGLSSCPLGHSCLTDGEFKIGGSGAMPTEQVIVTHLRFHDNYELRWGGCLENSAATLGMQYFFRNVVLDHLTLRNGTDSSPDLWTGAFDSSDVTISYTLMAFSNHPLLISDSGEGGSRDDMSVHHNVLARSDQRMPSVQFDTTDFDFRNNIVFDWGAATGGGYGMRIQNEAPAAGGHKVHANVVNNYLIAGNGNPRVAFYYGSGPGSESDTSGDGGPSTCTTSNGCATCPAQGTFVNGTFMGEIWTNGNVFPAAVCERYSTVAAERPVPSEARVPTTPASLLTDTVIPNVGTRYRLMDEQALLDEILAAMGGAPPGFTAPGNLRIVPPP